MSPFPAQAAIEQAIRDARGEAFRATAWTPVGGGCIHQTITLDDGHQRFFVKLGGLDRQSMFAAEADGLAAIAATAALRTPAVVAAGTDESHAFLVLEHLDMRPLQTPEEGARFAEALAHMHRSLGEHFGWPRDNFIGSNPQRNAETDNWSRFFVEQRLRPQFALAREHGFAGELQKQAGRLFERVPALFLDYRPKPSLVHGDLWHGNAGVLIDGTPVLFDPAAHRGDRESDIAMSELFGGFPSSFYACYRQAWPLNEDYESRKLLYSLYHIVNHLNLFGRGYLREAVRLTTRLNEELSLRRD